MANQYTRRDQARFTTMLADLIKTATVMGYEITLGEAWRPEWVALEYEKQGVGKKNSFHCRRLAIDLNVFKGGMWLKDGSMYTDLGTYWESLGGTWGQRFKKPDGNHFSLGE